MSKILAHEPRDILSVEELMAEIEQEEAQDFCELQELCHELLGIEGGGEYEYVCGFIPAGTAGNCPKRRRFMEEEL